VPPEERVLRADAARNAGRLLEAAHEVFAEQGPDAPLEAIADRAGVRVRTLFRHFPHKEALVRALLQRAMASRLPPILYRIPDYEPHLAIRFVMEAALGVVDHERSALAAAANPAALTAEITAPLLEHLATLTERAKEAGTIRTDVTGDDVARVLGMLVNYLWGMPEGGEGWRRHLLLVFDAFRPDGATPLAVSPLERVTDPLALVSAAADTVFTLPL
jgi:AcrR family transcriptional regulator